MVPPLEVFLKKKEKTTPATLTMFAKDNVVSGLEVVFLVCVRKALNGAHGPLHFC